VLRRETIFNLGIPRNPFKQRVYLHFFGPCCSACFNALPISSGEGLPWKYMLIAVFAGLQLSKLESGHAYGKQGEYQ